LVPFFLSSCTRFLSCFSPELLKEFTYVRILQSPLSFHNCAWLFINCSFVF
ncbi:hypothetical protein T4A_8754, partial [Trichinella pseudospiralis]